jgi:ABC-type polysaccharide/polyol phosphate export permease
MITTRHRTTGLAGVFSILALIYHNTVRTVRRGHGNALIGLLLNILQTIIFVTAFWFMMDVLGMKAVAIRGDFLLYLMSGIFVYMTHTKTVGAVFGSEGPTSAMMNHAPMNTAIAIMSSALATLYLQLLSMFVVIYVYHVAFNPITIEDPAGAIGMLLIAWFFGIAVGMVLLSIKPWWPQAATLVSTLYSRANMIASGKMFAANTLSYTMLKVFDWNPLFHLIDQTRGYTFLNYEPHKTSISYAVSVSLAIFGIGLMAEFYTRKNASISWGARR